MVYYGDVAPVGAAMIIEVVISVPSEISNCAIVAPVGGTTVE